MGVSRAQRKGISESHNTPRHMCSLGCGFSKDLKPCHQKVVSGVVLTQDKLSSGTQLAVCNRQGVGKDEPPKQ